MNIIDPKDQLPESLTPLQQEYKDYCRGQYTLGLKPDSIMQWAQDMHEAGGYDPLEPNLEPIPFEETPDYQELNQ